jgi:thioredoxin 1
MPILYSKEETFDQDISQGTVLVDYYADWCGPCKMIAPVLEQISGERDDITIVKLNVDENMAIAQKNGIRAIPTLALYKGGVQVDSKAGFMPKPKLVEWIDLPRN